MSASVLSEYYWRIIGVEISYISGSTGSEPHTLGPLFPAWLRPQLI